MVITFNELRAIKHSLPTGSVAKIARQLGVTEQAVRNYFGAKKIQDANEIPGWHYEPGPDGGVVHIEDETILNLAKKIIEEAKAGAAQ